MLVLREDGTAIFELGDLRIHRRRDARHGVAASASAAGTRLRTASWVGLTTEVLRPPMLASVSSPHRLRETIRLAGNPGMMFRWV